MSERPELPEEFDALIERRVDRKGFLAAGALSALVATGGGRLVDEADAATEAELLSGTLHYYNWAAYVNPKTYTQFTRETGVKVRKSFYTNNEALQAKLKAGARGYDLVVPTGYMVKILAAEKLLTPIDWSLIPNARRNLSSKFKSQPYDPGNRWSVAKDWGTTGFVYRTDLVKERPTTWKQFFDLMKGKYSGKVVLLNSSPEVIGSIAIMLGYSYSTSDRRELDKVKGFLLDLKKHVHSLDTVNYKQKVISGKAVMAMGWNGDGAVVAAKKPAMYVVPKEGAEYWIDCYCIPVGAKNRAAAHAWIDFCYRPRVNAQETSYTYYGSPLRRELLRRHLARSIYRNPAVFPPLSTLRHLEPNRVTAAGTRLRERIWTEFKAA
jgi:spermidine/putrescine transport system substrate-binding protein